MKNKFLFLFFILFGTKITAQTPASFTIQTDKPIANVAPTMWGIFFEDINLGADGGIYAELLKTALLNLLNL
jgi:alpha-L-arabinofuranosidase